MLGGCVFGTEPGVEICNSRDDDDDGVIDEGGVCGCGFFDGCGGFDDDCDGLVDEDCAGCEAESCNGVDDDCDGVVDEDALSDPAIPEVANGFDDDCDGVVDEDIDVGCSPMTLDTGREIDLCAGAVTWTTAQSECRARGRFLVSIHSEAENAAINRLADDPWIGLDASGTWTDGTPRDFDAAIDTAGDDECFWLSSSGSWLASRCTQTRPFVCAPTP